MLQSAGQDATWHESPERFYEFLKNESVKWSKIVKASGALIE